MRIEDMSTEQKYKAIDILAFELSKFSPKALKENGINTPLKLQGMHFGVKELQGELEVEKED